MAIEKILKSPDIIFDPIPSYVGIWMFGTENLVKNSKKENGKNLFSEYYQKTVTEPLKKFFQCWDYLRVPLGFISAANDNLVGRRLSINKIDFFIGLTQFLNSNLDRYGKSDEEYSKFIDELTKNIESDNDTLNNFYSKVLGEKAEKLKTLLDDEFNSIYYEAISKDYEDYNSYRKTSISFTKYVQSTYAVTVSLQKGLKILGDFLDQSLDSNKLYECFEPDVFYLLFATIVYEYNLMSEKEFDTLDTSYLYLYHYFKAAEETIKEDKKYNPTILYEWKNGKKEKLSRRELKIKYDELMQRHPEVKPFNLPDIDDPTKYKDINLMTQLRDLYEGEASLNWEFLPQGQSIKKSEDLTPSKRKSRTIDKEKLIKETDMRIDILKNSGYVGRPFKGLNSFNGYYAFVFPNGKVVLEKFWENEKNMTPSIENATYVMTIDNFVEMSRLSKPTLINYIKTLPDIGIRRIFHTSLNEWQSELFEEINGNAYRLEDVINFINSLQNEVTRNE